jgi:hypothetical protein
MLPPSSAQACTAIYACVSCTNVRKPSQFIELNATAILLLCCCCAAVLELDEFGVAF